VSGIHDGGTGQDAEHHLQSSDFEVTKPRTKPDSFQSDQLAWVISEKKQACDNVYFYSTNLFSLLLMSIIIFTAVIKVRLC